MEKDYNVWIPPVMPVITEVDPQDKADDPIITPWWSPEIAQQPLPPRLPGVRHPETPAIMGPQGSSH